jgi:hypothetical protein
MISDDAISYLRATGAAACYVATVALAPVRVGVCRDPQRSLDHLMRRWNDVTFGWLAWINDHHRNAAIFTAELVAGSSEIIFDRDDDGVRTSRSLSYVVGKIEQIAEHHSIALTSHDMALKRARLYAQKLDNVLAALQQRGAFHAFNHAYRVHREQARNRNESVLPYFAVRDELRRVIIRYLVAHDDRIDVGAVLEEIRQRFPWFQAVEERQKRTVSRQTV